MAVDVIGREIDQHADRRRQRGRQIDLEGGAFDDVNAPFGGRLEIEDRHADIAAELHVAPRCRRIWAISAVVVDLPLVPVMR